MIKVYFEMKNAKYSELVAAFESGETYIKCLPALKKECKKQGFDFVSETEENETGKIKCLFEDYEKQPKKLKETLDKYTGKLMEGMSYKGLNRLRNKIEKIGFTFDYYLDAEPFGLRPMYLDLNELEGFEDAK